MRLGNKLRASLLNPKVRHYSGTPPEVTDNNNREQMPTASVLVIEDGSDGAFFLYRFSADGRFGGDTWHPNVEEAKEQAVFEFGELLSDWVSIPSDIKDEAVVPFMMAGAAPR